MQLSKRLSAVSDMVTSKSRLADVGTDHGYIPIYLVKSGRVPQAIALDINQGPLKRAEENIELHQLSTYIETRLSDGVAALNTDEADCVVIAGMGGGLVIKILSEGSEVLKSVRELVLSPQSELSLVRHYLEENRYCLTEENMVLDEGKYYTIMKVVHGCMSYDREIDYKYGRILIEHKNECLLSFLDKEQRTYEKVLVGLSEYKKDQTMQRKKEIEQELLCIKMAKEEMAK